MRLSTNTDVLQVYAGAFSSFTVAMTHRIKATARIQHVESGHVFELECKFPFHITDPYAFSPEAAYKQARQIDPIVSNIGQIMDNAEEPPTYADAKGVSGPPPPFKPRA